MRLRTGWLLLAFFACSSSSNHSAPDAGSDAGRDAGADAVAGDAQADASAGAPPLDCSQDDADWPMYNHDVCNTRAPSTSGGISQQTAAKLSVKWTYAAAGEISATPTVVGGQLYVPDWGGMMTRIDAATGTPVWSKSVADLAGLTADGGAPPDPVVARDTPVVTSQALIFGLSRTGFSSQQSLAYLVAVDPNTGALLWKTLLDNHPASTITGSPVLEGTTLYVGISSLEEALPLYDPAYACCTFRGSVAALDVTTGNILWQTHTIDDATYFGADGKTPAGYAGAAVWSGVPTIDRHRQRLYVTTGNNYSMPSGVTAAPSGDHVESIMALDMATGAIVWSRSMTMDDVFTLANTTGPDYDFGCGANLFQASIDGVVKDLVGAGQKSGIYWVLDPDTGDQVWKTQTGPGGHLGGLQWGTAYDGTRIYFGDNDTDSTTYTLAGKGPQSGKSVATGSWGSMDPSSGDVLWQIANPALSAPLGGASVNGPVTVVGGVMFGGSMDAQGTMYALDASSGAVLWSFQAGGTVYGGPAVAGGVVYWGAGYIPGRLGFGTSAKKLYAFAPM
jgi:polyvinyl alcohol dehydrogenase (cytochrome)